MRLARSVSFFFFNDTATTEIYTLSLHDALPISIKGVNPRTKRPFIWHMFHARGGGGASPAGDGWETAGERSEEHTSELQSRLHLVCRLLLEKKKKSRSRCLCAQYAASLRYARGR